MHSGSWEPEKSDVVSVLQLSAFLFVTS